MNSNIYVTLKGQPAGPFHKEQVEEMVRTDVLTENDQYRIHGSNDWKPISYLLNPPPGEMDPGLLPVRPKNMEDPDPYGHPGFWRRLSAFVIDIVVLSFGIQMISPVLAWIAFTINDQWVLTNLLKNSLNSTLIYAYVTAIVISWLYFALMESSFKRATVGKIACGIIVTDEHGEKISFARASVRRFSSIFSFLLLGFGFVMCAFTAQKRCLHDIIAGTLVFKKPQD